MAKPKLPAHFTDHRPAESKFFFTINCNRHVKSFGEYLPFWVHKLKRVVKSLFLEDANQAYAFKPYNDERTKKDVEYKGREQWLNEFVIPDTFFFIGAVEEGGQHSGMRNGRLHCHVLMKLKHRTRLQLDTAFIMNFIKQEMGFDKNIYFYNELTGRSAQDEINALEYINKYARSNPQYLISPAIEDVYDGPIPPTEEMPPDVDPDQTDAKEIDKEGVDEFEEEIEGETEEK